MTKKEIHIRAVLKRKGYESDPIGNMLRFNKYHWTKVEPKKRKTYCHVVIYIDIAANRASATFYTEFTFKSVSELEKYYIVYNRVKGDMQELGLELN